MYETVLLLGLAIAAVGVFIIWAGTLRTPMRGMNGKLIMLGLLIALFGGAMVIAVGGATRDRSVAISSGSGVSAELGKQIEAAQRMSSQQVANVNGLAKAELDNKTGQSLLNKSLGEMHLADAQALKTTEEAKTIKYNRDKDMNGAMLLSIKELLGGEKDAGGNLTFILLFGALVFLFLGTKLRVRR